MVVVGRSLMNNQSDPWVFTGVFVNPACVSIIVYVNERNSRGSTNRVDVELTYPGTTTKSG